MYLIHQTVFSVLGVPDVPSLSQCQTLFVYINIFVNMFILLLLYKVFVRNQNSVSVKAC